MRTTSRLLASLAVAGLASSLSACYAKPGDYKIYKITFLPEVQQADCNVEIDIRDSTTFFGAATFAMFATDGDDFFIEYEGQVITGSRDGKEFAFEGVSVNVDDPIDGTTVTVTNSLNVDLTLNGREITGTATGFASTVCSGNCDGIPVGQCTTVRDFFGTEIKDVELEHPI